MTEISIDAAGQPMPKWLSAWMPPGSFDPAAQVFLGPSAEAASFPDDGIDLFGDVDENSFWFTHRASVILEELARSGQPTPAVLEVGSGSGAVAAELVRAGHEVMTVEPSRGGAARARARGATVAFEGTLHEARLPESTFDAVGFFDVIEHLEDWRTVVDEAHRVMKSTGRLVVTVPAYQWLWSEHDDWNEHKRRYSKAMLVSDLGEAGFHVERVTYFFAPLVAPALLRRAAYVAGRKSDLGHEDRLRRQLQPNDVANRLLSGVLRFEQRLLSRASLPFGTSLIAVATPEHGGSA